MAGTKLLLFDKRPSLREEWDYSKNVGIDPETLSFGSGVRAWWKCKNGHEWQVRASTRGDGRGCRACNHDEIVKSNPLSLDEELAQQLDDSRYLPSELSLSSDAIVWWKCEKDHRWEARVGTRSHSRTGCPYCSGYFPIQGETDLATLRPDLAAQWDDDTISPTEVTVSTMKKVWWKCEKGHRWKTAINYRNNSRTKGNGCPYCATKGRYARAVVGVNDLATLHPDIAAELDSTDITAQELREFSNKKLPWKCSMGHKWITMVSTRVVYGSGCPDCALIRTSKIEGRLRTLVSTKDYLTNTVLDENHRLPVPFRKNKAMSVDIYCEWLSLPVVIEYDGAFWHHSDASRKRDIDKTNALLAHGYLVIRIRENLLPMLEIQHDNLFQMNVTYSVNEDKHLEDAVNDIESWLNSRK